MIPTKRIVMAGTVFLSALSIGFVMQNGNAIASRLGAGAPTVIASGSLAPAPVQQAAVAPAVMKVAPVDVTPVTFTKDPENAVEALAERAGWMPVDPALPVPAHRTVALRSAPAPQNKVADLPDYGDLGQPCTIEIAISPKDMGRMAVAITAPCQPGTPFTATHNGLALTGQTDPNGNGFFDLPAFQTDARVTARFDDGSMAEGSATIASAATHRHIVLHWQGSTEMALHAFEDGASFGAPGHLYADAASPSPDAMGILSEFGTSFVPGAARMQVYSYPNDLNGKSDPKIEVEAPITASVCARDLSADLWQGGTAFPISIAMPGCEAIGNVVVLTDDMLPVSAIASR